MNCAHPVSHKIAKLLLSYDSKTGAFVWRRRGDELFIGSEAARRGHAKRWNNKYANKSAGSVDSRGYYRMTIFGKNYSAHRLAWLISFGEWPSQFIDHINGNKTDNRIANLRECTNAQNLQNIPSSNSRGAVSELGVTLHKQTGKFQAQIKVNGKCIYLGLYQTEHRAGRAYLAAKKIHHKFQPTPRKETQ